MKRLITVILLTGVCLMLSGCDLGKPSIPITEEESNAIAQYCAHLLMKHGAHDLYYKSTNEKLLDKKEYETAYAEREAILHPTPTPTPTPEPTPEEENPSLGPGSFGSGDDDGAGRTTVEDASVLFDPSVFAIIVNEPVFEEQYMGSGEYFALSAPEGKLVAVFSLDVTNISSDPAVFDYNDFSAVFQLVADSSVSIEPEISLLENDFRFTRTEILPGDTFNGAVVFFVDKNAKTFIFRIIGGNKAYELYTTNSAEVENGN